MGDVLKFTPRIPLVRDGIIDKGTDAPIHDIAEGVAIQKRKKADKATLPEDIALKKETESQIDELKEALKVLEHAQQLKRDELVRLRDNHELMFDNQARIKLELDGFLREEERLRDQLAELNRTLKDLTPPDHEGTTDI